jgi:hypothetical protein
VFILGKVLQALGCADVGFALWVGITQPHGMGSEFEIAAIGIGVFVLGYIAETYSRSGS